MHDTDSTQTCNWEHCQLNTTVHRFVACQDYSKFSLPLLSFFIVLLDTSGGFFYTFFEVVTNLTGKIFSSSLPKGFFSFYIITIFLGGFMSCSVTNIKIGNIANISKRLRYGRDLFLTWTRKLRNGTYVVRTVGGFFAQIDIWLLSKNLLVQLRAWGYDFLHFLVLHCYLALLHPSCVQVTWVCPSNLRY